MICLVLKGSHPIRLQVQQPKTSQRPINASCQCTVADLFRQISSLIGSVNTWTISPSIRHRIPSKRSARNVRGKANKKAWVSPPMLLRTNRPLKTNLSLSNPRGNVLETSTRLRVFHFQNFFGESGADMVKTPQQVRKSSVKKNFSVPRRHPLSSPLLV